MKTHRVSYLERALELAENGYKVYPVDPQTHQPLFYGAMEQATTDHQIIRKWFRDYPHAAIAMLDADDAESAGNDNASEGRPRIPWMALPVMLERAVFLTDGSFVTLLNKPSIVYSLRDFQNALAGARTNVVVNGEEKSVPTVKLWLEDQNRVTVVTQTHAPGRPAFCEAPDGRSAVNTWRPRARVRPERSAEFVSAFFNHLRYLIPEDGELNSFIDWLAHAEQKPGELPTHHHLWVTPQTGIGRNWVGNALAKTWPGEVALGFDLGGSIRSGFNGALARSLFAVVDELHEGGPGSSRERNTLSERLKSMLTETVRLINPKYGRQHYAYNCTRMLMFSNHDAALPIAERDRRIAVTANPTERKPPEYYQELYALLEEPGFGDAIGLWLSHRDLSNFNPGAHAPMNEAKKKTVRAGRTEHEQALRDIAAEWPCDLITNNQLKLELHSSLGENVNSVQRYAVDAGLTKLSQRPWVDGKRAHVWCIRNLETWKDKKPEDIAAEMKRFGSGRSEHHPRQADTIFKED